MKQILQEQIDKDRKHITNVIIFDNGISYVKNVFTRKDVTSLKCLENTIYKIS